MAEKEFDINAWINRRLNGLFVMERYELAVRLGSDEFCASSWIIRCLANPKCEGSQEVLDAIAERRKEVSEVKEDPNQAAMTFTNNELSIPGE